MYGYIYETTNLINGKKYIGKHKSNVFDQNYLGSGKILTQAINKYGVENFVCKILDQVQDVPTICETKEQLNESEKFYIKIFNASLNENYYNIAQGGDGGILWEPGNHPSKHVDRTGNKNPMWGKSIFDCMTQDKADLVKLHIKQGRKNYIEKHGKPHRMVDTDGKVRIIFEDKLQEALDSGFKFQNQKTLEENMLSEEELFIKWKEEKHTCARCGKVMTEKWGSGIYCCKSCASKRKHTEEEKIKISNSEKGKKCSQEQIEKYRITMNNKSQEEIDLMKEKMRLSHLGKKLTEEQKKKISNTIKEKRKAGIIKSRKGLPAPNKGMKMSNEQKDKMSKIFSGRVWVHNVEGKTKFVDKEICNNLLSEGWMLGRGKIKKEEII